MNDTKANKPLLALALIAALASTTSCAVKGDAPPSKAAPVASAEVSDLGPQDNDPLEPVNRGIFKVNEVVDGLVLKPVAHIYRGVLPAPVRTGVHNALTNLSAPVVFVNSALQGDNTNMANTLGRFLINSTLGVAGIFDVASEMGVAKANKKDFGQTLGVHGVGPGPYIVLPILGPSNLRDGFGLAADTAMDPFTYIFDMPTTIAVDSVRIIDRRTELLPLTDRVYRDSLDPYATLRSIYQQHRTKVVKNYLKADTNQVENTSKKK